MELCVRSRRAIGLSRLRKMGWTLADATFPLLSLLKLRIVALLLFVSVATAFLAASLAQETMPLLLLVVAGTLSAGGAGALNHYFERDLDSLMERTKRRPLVTGRLGRPRVALVLGLSLVAISFTIALPLSAWLSFFLLAGALIYVVVYTLWLKRRSRWGVVVGGAAGSCAVLAGWASVASWIAPQPLLIALLLFFWTPPHFWSLAILRLDDYRKAQVPMLPVVVGPAAAARWGLAHVLLVAMVSAGLGMNGSFGLLYVRVAFIAGVLFVASALWLALQTNSNTARLHFRSSIAYIVALFAGMMLDVYLAAP